MPSFVKTGRGCCRDLSHKTVTIVIGCIHIVSAVLIFSYSCVAYAEQQYHSNSNEILYLIFSIMESVICIYSSILLIVGSIRRKELLLLPFIIYLTVAIPGRLIFMIYKWKKKNVEFVCISKELSSFILLAAGDIYLLSVVIRRFQKIIDDKGRNNAQRCCSY